MSCKNMSYIDRFLWDLTHEQKERVRSLICSRLCNGRCKDEYLERGGGSNGKCNDM